MCLGSTGPVAQLGERLVCIQEVVGSNPVGSTNPIVARVMFVRAGFESGFPARETGARGDIASEASRRSPRITLGPIAQSG